MILLSTWLLTLVTLVQAGDKYELFMVEDNTERNEAALQGRMPEQSEPRIAFRLVSGEFSRPPQAGVGKTIGSAFLFLATFASCAQLGLLANVAKLPKVQHSSASPAFRSCRYRIACGVSGQALLALSSVRFGC